MQLGAIVILRRMRAIGELGIRKFKEPAATTDDKIKRWKKSVASRALRLASIEIKTAEEKRAVIFLYGETLSSRGHTPHTGSQQLFFF
jgi:hypothetical protein